MLLGTVLGMNAVAPAPVSAGVIPWMYDAIFGPVGSMRANRMAYSAGYGGGYGMAYSAYAPTTVAYAPVSMASYGGYGGGGCSTCSQSANYTPSYEAYYGGQSYVGTGCSTCNSCGTGGYVGSTGCSNCSANPTAPSTSTYYGGTAPLGSPTPDTSNVLQRLNQLELHQKEIDRQLKRQHNSGGASADPYSGAEPFTNRTHRPGTSGETVHPRNGDEPRSNKTFDSNPVDEAFPQPRRGGGAAPGTPPVDEDAIDRQENRKPEVDLAPPVVIPDPKPAEAVPQALRLDSRVTTRAIAPRDRMRVTSKPAPTKVSQSSKKPTTSWLDSSLTSDVSRH